MGRNSSLDEELLEVVFKAIVRIGIRKEIRVQKSNDLISNKTVNWLVVMVNCISAATNYI